MKALTTGNKKKTGIKRKILKTVVQCLSACILLVFSSGSWYTMIAPWIGPVLLLLLLRGSHKLKAAGIAWLVQMAAFSIGWRYVLDYFDLPVFFLFALAVSLIRILPYLADRLLSEYVPPKASFLVFPLAWVTCDFLMMYIPFFSGFSLVYSQYQNLPLMQLLAVTGPLGLSFLLGLHASLLADIWLLRSEWQLVRRKAFLLIASVTLCMMAGGILLAVFRPDGDTVPVGIALSSNDDSFFPDENGFADKLLGDGGYDPVMYERMLALCDMVNDELLEKSRKLIAAGAKILVWHEYDAHIPKTGETALLESVRALARENEVYFLCHLVTIETDPFLRTNGKALENKIVAINSRGETAFEYYKAKPVPGWESWHIRNGADETQIMETEFGALSAVICADINFPDLLRTAGKKNADILFVPAFEDPAMDPYQRIQAHFRAVENGFSVVRAASGARSGGVDYQGNTLGTMSCLQKGNRMLMVYPPIKGVKTLYAALGNWLGWLSAFGFILLLCLANRNCQCVFMRLLYKKKEHHHGTQKTREKRT